jgi:hypothetical protein
MAEHGHLRRLREHLSRHRQTVSDGEVVIVIQVGAEGDIFAPTSQPVSLPEAVVRGILLRPAVIVVEL